MGFYNCVDTVKQSCTYKDEKKEGYYYKIYIHIDQICHIIPTILKYKRLPSKVKSLDNPKIDISGKLKMIGQKNV